MDIDDSQFTDKDSKRPEYRTLYERAPDFVTAYSAHTDLRIGTDGPEAAIGGLWDEQGPAQLQFWVDRGLGPHARFLDFGCGTGRFARQVVKFLAAGCYTGVDISQAALEHCEKLAVREGWVERRPWFVRGSGGVPNIVRDETFDRVWAFSVFTHLPPELISAVLADLAVMEFGEFCFTYKRRPEPLRTGLKQFGYPPEFFAALAVPLGLQAEELTDHWPGGQHTMRVWR